MRKEAADTAVADTRAVVAMLAAAEDQVVAVLDLAVADRCDQVAAEVLGLVVVELGPAAELAGLVVVMEVEGPAAATDKGIELVAQASTELSVGIIALHIHGHLIYGAAEDFIATILISSILIARISLGPIIIL